MHTINQYIGFVSHIHLDITGNNLFSFNNINDSANFYVNITIVILRDMTSAESM